MYCNHVNDYDLFESIGQGSFSFVRRARHKITKEYVAIKCIQRSRLSESLLENVFSEIQVLKKLKHPNIVEMIDFRFDGKYIYIIMELCSDGNLYTFIKKHHKLPESTCQYFMKQLAYALKYMHEKNIGHFDLKPHNLLLKKTQQLTLKIADFGFAQFLNHDEDNTVIKGSPLYMAPEILLKNCYNSTADLWSIGVILYECLFGHAPYRSKTLEEVLLKVKNQEKIDIDQIVCTPPISNSCKDILKKLLISDPKKRITFTEFFTHPFLNLVNESMTSDEMKCITLLLRQAVDDDNDGNYDSAYHLYCKAVHFLEQLEQVDAKTDMEILSKIQVYRKRIEELKVICENNEVCEIVTKSKASSLTSSSQSSVRPSNTMENKHLNLPTNNSTNNQVVKPTDSYQILYDLCNSSPHLQIALDNGRLGDSFVGVNNLKSALEQYKEALGILVPHMSKEPKGHRKELLHKQALDWMDKAECVKSKMSPDIIKNEEKHCCLQ